MFDPEDGSLMLPECLGNIDTLAGKVNFESTSSNVGKSLRLKRQDVRVGCKQIIVIVQNPGSGDEGGEETKEEKDTQARCEDARKLWKNIKGKDIEKREEYKTKVGILKKRTQKMIDFFVEDLDFKHRNPKGGAEYIESILYFTEQEIRQIVKLLDQSKIFKEYPKNLESRIITQARNIF